MDFFLHKYIALLKKVFINPRSRVEYFLGWMNALFWTLKSQHKKLWRARAFLNITLIVFVWNNKVIYTQDGLRVSKSCSNFHFWVNYPFKLTVRCLVTSASILDLFMAFSTSNSGALMNTTYGKNSDVLRTFRVYGKKIQIGIKKWFSWNTIKVIMKSHRCWCLTCGLTSRIQMRPASTTSWMESILVP